MQIKQENHKICNVQYSSLVKTVAKSTIQLCLFVELNGKLTLFWFFTFKIQTTEYFTYEEQVPYFNAIYKLSISFTSRTFVFAINGLKSVTN